MRTIFFCSSYFDVHVHAVYSIWMSFFCVRYCCRANWIWLCRWFAQFWLELVFLLLFLYFYDQTIHFHHFYINRDVTLVNSQLFSAFPANFFHSLSFRLFCHRHWVIWLVLLGAKGVECKNVYIWISST